MLSVQNILEANFQQGGYLTETVNLYNDVDLKGQILTTTRSDFSNSWWRVTDTKLNIRSMMSRFQTIPVFFLKIHTGRYRRAFRVGLYVVGCVSVGTCGLRCEEDMGGPGGGLEKNRQ